MISLIKLYILLASWRLFDSTNWYQFALSVCLGSLHISHRLRYLQNLRNHYASMSVGVLIICWNNDTAVAICCLWYGKICQNYLSLWCPLSFVFFTILISSWNIAQLIYSILLINCSLHVLHLQSWLSTGLFIAKNWLMQGIAIEIDWN